jgi:hypothetical protein
MYNKVDKIMVNILFKENNIIEKFIFRSLKYFLFLIAF